MRRAVLNLECGEITEKSQNPLASAPSPRAAAAQIAAGSLRARCGLVARRTLVQRMPRTLPHVAPQRRSIRFMFHLSLSLSLQKRAAQPGCIPSRPGRSFTRYTVIPSLRCAETSDSNEAASNAPCMMPAMKDAQFTEP